LASYTTSARGPIFQKLRDLIAEGELGEITRITWLITDWFRTWTYYASGGWRATWAGEGGGVLINQCPHNLDLVQWIPNMMPEPNHRRRRDRQDASDRSGG